MIKNDLQKHTITELVKKYSDSILAKHPNRFLANRARAILDSPNADLRGLKKAIELDIFLTANIMKHANSVSIDVTDLDKAIRILGINTIRKILDDQQNSLWSSRKLNRNNIELFPVWEQSVRVANCVRNFAEKYPINTALSPSSLYIIGLLYRMGEIFLEENQHVFYLETNKENFSRKYTENIVGKAIMRAKASPLDVLSALFKAWHYPKSFSLLLDSIVSRQFSSHYGNDALLIVIAQKIVSNSQKEPEELIYLEETFSAKDLYDVFRYSEQFQNQLKQISKFVI